MLMARAKPDGLPTYLSTCLPDRPLNMYRRSLSLSLFPPSSSRLVLLYFAFVVSSRDPRNEVTNRPTNQPTIEFDYGRLTFDAGTNFLHL